MTSCATLIHFSHHPHSSTVAVPAELSRLLEIYTQAMGKVACYKERMRYIKLQMHIKVRECICHWKTVTFYEDSTFTGSLKLDEILCKNREQEHGLRGQKKSFNTELTMTFHIVFKWFYLTPV